MNQPSYSALQKRLYSSVLRVSVSGRSPIAKLSKGLIVGSSKLQYGSVASKVTVRTSELDKYISMDYQKKKKTYQSQQTMHTIEVKLISSLSICTHILALVDFYAYDESVAKKKG